MALRLSVERIFATIVDNDDGVAALKLGHFSICFELNIRQFTVIRLNYILVFDMILLVPSNLNEDPVASARRLF